MASVTRSFVSQSAAVRSLGFRLVRLDGGMLDDLEEGTAMRLGLN